MKNTYLFELPTHKQLTSSGAFQLADTDIMLETMMEAMTVTMIGTTVRSARRHGHHGDDDGLSEATTVTMIRANCRVIKTLTLESEVVCPSLLSLLSLLSSYLIFCTSGNGSSPRTYLASYISST